MWQITYLLFLRRLDELHTQEESQSQRLGKPMERRIYPEGKYDKKRDYTDLRWDHLKNFSPSELYAVVNDLAFPFLRTRTAGDDSTYAHHTYL